MTTVLVCGGRDFTDRQLVRDVLDKVLLPQPLTADPATWFPRPGLRMVTGECKTGADRFAADWAVANFCYYQGYPVDEAIDGPWPRAGRMRNVRMFNAEHPKLLISFPGGPGTSHMTGVGLSAPFCHVLSIDTVASPLEKINDARRAIGLETMS